MSLVIRGADTGRAAETAEKLFQYLQSQNQEKTVEVFESQPDAVAKLRGQYRFQILLKGKSVLPLTRAVKNSIKSFKRSGIMISMNVDP